MAVSVSASGADRVVVRPVEVGEEDAVLAAYARLFEGDVDARAPAAPTRRLLAWRHADNPDGARLLAAFEGDRVVGLIAGCAQGALHEGEPASVGRVDDVRVDPRRRRGLGGPGLVIRMGRAWDDAFGGVDRDVLSWGFPTPSAWRVANWHLKVQAVRTQLALYAAPDEVRSGSAAGVEVEPVERFDSDVDGFCAGLAAGRGLSIRRDAERLDWRFRQRPDRDYEQAVARRGSQVAGLAVFRAGAFDGVDRRGLVCDWQVAPDDRAAASALLAWTVERARAAGCAELVHLLPETAPDWRLLQDRAGFVARRLSTRFLLAQRPSSKRLRMHWLHANWHYTLGDTDFG